MFDLYCDGGVIQSNPSPHGGTWTFCWIEKDRLVYQNSGVVAPDDLGVPRITNNQMELYAAIRALQSVKASWKGCLYTDSKVTYHRLLRGKSFEGIPNWLRLETLNRHRLFHKIGLLGGHPTKKELLAGCRADGTPVSIWNQWCDQECQRLAKEFLHAKSTLS